jgi:glycine/D-amino acid oxidase-like deaminating enzyme
LTRSYLPSPQNGGHCQPLLYFYPPSSATFEVKNFHFLADLISNSNIPCDFFRFPNGGCHAYYSRQAFERAKVAIRELESLSPDLSSQIEVIEDRAELASLKIPHAVGAILQSHAAGLHPYKLVTWLWSQLLESSNLNLQTGTPVLSISPSHSSRAHDCWTVTTPRGTISAPHVLVATNGYTAHLLPDSFRSLIVPVQGQMSALKPPAMMLEKSLEHDYTFLGKEQDDYLVQRPVQTGGHFMFGGGRRVVASWGVGVSDDSKLDERVARYLRTMIPKVMNLEAPRARVENAETGIPSVPEGWEFVEALEDGGTKKELHAEAEWTGVMGYSRDGCPWVGGVPGQEGLWVCGGYTGHGKAPTLFSMVTDGLGRANLARDAECESIGNTRGATHYYREWTARLARG